MSSEKEPQKEVNGHSAKGSVQSSDSSPDLAPDASSSPAWADGLKQLYRSVVDEPLPGNFQDLLDQFDETDEEDRPSDSGNPA